LEFYGFVGLEELGVDDHSGLSCEVFGVVFQIVVGFDAVNDFQEADKKLLVSRVIETL
jgi:hypothetical protein